MADSWYHEGGIRGYSQAEAEYKDFILFYPQMEEAAESQKRICDIHYQQMEKADRDPNQALRAEQECRLLMTRFPNSVFIGETEQTLRKIQEVIAEGEFRVGVFYRSRGNPNAAANRLGGVADQYPLYSQADEALWLEGLSLRQLGPGFRDQESDSLVRIVRDYPLSARVDEAKTRLKELEVRIPDPDPVALARMQANIDSRVPPGLLSRSFGFMRRGPDTWTAAKNGAPQMAPAKQNIPPLTPLPGGRNAGFQGDVTVAPVPPQPAPAKP
jgi:outer membrane protein assembly factor BamD